MSFATQRVGRASVPAALSACSVVTLVVLLCISCVPQPTPLPAPAPISAPPCDPLSSGELLIGGLEDADGYDDALAALDLSAQPATLPLDVTGLQRNVALYMLELDAFDPTSPTTLDRDDAIASGPLGRAVVGAYANGGGALDFAFLRRGLHRFYACDRGLPRTLAEFNERVVDVAGIPEGETVDSDVKGLPRRMRRSAADGVFVAETLVDDGSVRETEIIWTDQRSDGALEFLEYDANGNLRSASTFATSAGGESVGAVPFTCMACHGTHDVTPP